MHGVERTRLEGNDPNPWIKSLKETSNEADHGKPHIPKRRTSQSKTRRVNVMQEGGPFAKSERANICPASYMFSGQMDRKVCVFSEA